MSIRREPTYLSTQTWRAMWLLAKAKSTEEKSITVDQLIDETLHQFIESEYPQLFEHQKQIDKLEKELLKTL